VQGFEVRLFLEKSGGDIFCQKIRLSFKSLLQPLFAFNTLNSSQWLKFDLFDLEKMSAFVEVFDLELSCGLYAYDAPDE
jgi:hypothetical protein